MSIALELHGRKKTGTVCSRDHRNGNNCPLILRSTSEDLLTANVFGLLRHFPPKLWLAPLLNASLETTRFSQVPFADFRMSFWTEIPPPPSRGRTEGPTEVDVSICFDSFAVFIEAKLHAPLAPGTARDPNRNQLARLIHVAHAATREGQLFDREPVVLVIGPTPRPPALVSRYWSPANLRRDIGDDLDGPSSALMARNLGWASWTCVSKALLRHIGSSGVERSIASELQSYAERKEAQYQQSLRPQLTPRPPQDCSPCGAS